MSLLSMKSEFLIPEREFVINKNTTIGSLQSIICSLTEQDNCIKLWVLQKLPTEINTEEISLYSDFSTNRDELIKNSPKNQRENRFISEISIQDIVLKVTSSSSYIVGETPMSFAKLQHFMEIGIDFTALEDASFTELILNEYLLEGNTVFPEINENENMKIFLKVNETSYAVLLDKNFEFNLNVGKHEIEDSFIDLSNNEKIDFYINEIICYDIWEEHINRFNDKETIEKLKENGFDDKTIQKMKDEAPKHLKDICPEGHVLLIIKYECDYQLNFYTTEFLEEKPLYNGTSFCIISDSDDEKTKHGKKIRTSLLKTVPFEFNGDVKIELLSCHRIISSEIVKVDFKN